MYFLLIAALYLLQHNSFVPFRFHQSVGPFRSIGPQIAKRKSERPPRQRPSLLTLLDGLLATVSLLPPPPSTAGMEFPAAVIWTDGGGGGV